MLEDISGLLYVVATPIGNLQDLSPRALEVLKSVDLILAEDTRSFGLLKQRFGIETPAKSYFDQNEARRSSEMLELLKAGKNLALVSEAGTPTISDPGFRLVRAAHDAGVKLRTVPGPSAVIAALSISGLEPDRFVFAGFLPQKSGQRKKELSWALSLQMTCVYYESPHRILKTLEELATLAPNRRICLARELTKIHEEVIRTKAITLFEEFAKRPSIKGEIVLLIGREDIPQETENAESAE